MHLAGSQHHHAAARVTAMKSRGLDSPKAQQQDRQRPRRRIPQPARGTAGRLPPRATTWPRTARRNSGAMLVALSKLSSTLLRGLCPSFFDQLSRQDNPESKIRQETSMKPNFFRSFLLAFTSLLGSTAVSADSWQLSGDAWLTYEVVRKVLTVHQPPPVPPLAIRMPASVFGADLDSGSATLCVRSDRQLWRMDLAKQRMMVSELPSESSGSLRDVVATHDGSCVTSISDTVMRVLAPTGQMHDIQLLLPKNVKKFDLRSLSYDNKHGALLVIGEQAFTVIQTTSKKEAVKLQAVFGELEVGSINQKTHFSELTCCARLSDDGKTLFAYAQLGDEMRSGFKGLIAVDVGTGQYKRLYLPFSPKWFETGREQSFLFSDLEWYVGGGRFIGPGRTSSELMVWGYADLDPESKGHEGALLHVNIASGHVRAEPVHGQTFIGLLSSGRYSLRSKGEVMLLLDERTGSVVGQNSGEVLAIAHSKKPEARLKIDAVDSSKLLAFQSDRLQKVGFNLGPDFIADMSQYLRKTRNIEDLWMAMDTTYILRNKETGELEANIEMSELIGHLQSLPVPQTHLPMPSRMNAGDKDQESWGNFLEACDNYAQAQAGASELALMQCIASAW